ncbi:hypothetical protein FA15DRAFT_759840 [Coprinopsis marcescibilis]|uniref:Uncharacterized protein n=1 Tax=Coprinopsis marcescibilis TaxID=230819 RepID=A0A5C3KI78_COPMA|nr:hypothetical protein FA15DRAFT_759840 [Coprinopsis marcescibilis]
MRASLSQLLILLSVVGVQRVLSLEEGFDFDARAVGGALSFDDELVSRGFYYDDEELAFRDFYDDEDLISRYYEQEEDLYSRYVVPATQPLTPEAIQKELAAVDQSQIGRLEGGRQLAALACYQRARLLNSEIVKNSKRFKNPKRWSRAMRGTMAHCKKILFNDGFNGSGKGPLASPALTPTFKDKTLPSRETLLKVIKKVPYSRFVASTSSVGEDMEKIRNYRKAEYLKNYWKRVASTLNSKSNGFKAAKKRSAEWGTLARKYYNKVLGVGVAKRFSAGGSKK